MANDIQVVQKTVAIFDNVNWAKYGNHQSNDYLSYTQGQYGDEVSLMDGLLGRLLEQVMGFTMNQNIHQQITMHATGKRPDYVPDDTHLHSFVFDAKGTDTINLDQHYNQIAGYMRTLGAQYGVLTNMRDLAVYTLHDQQPERDYSFSFRQLYADYKQNPDSVVHTPNTQNFLRFVDRFRRQELNQVGKITAISERHRDDVIQLDLDDLVQRLHMIVNVMHEDVRQQRTVLPQVLGRNSERKQRIALEIDEIARETNASVPQRDVQASTLNTLLAAVPGSVDEQAADRYFYQVAYFAMTRILLARVWEDIGFIKETLYDGGFKHWYEYYNAQVQAVLSQAFHFAGERYSWLYGADNNYTWYTPSEHALVDVLYEFSRFDFRSLNADVLGAVYEAYLDQADRKNKGQYYTPRAMVQFIWDRVGFDQPSQIFRFEGGSRQPRVILDFCTGSGGFVVEAARRIREAVLGTNFNHDNPDDLRRVSVDDLTLAMDAITGDIGGSEINGFAYYLTEVNLLIQLTPLVAAFLKKTPNAPQFGQDYALSVIHQDSLKLHNRPNLTLPDLDEQHQPVGEVYQQDRRRDIVNLEGAKRAVYQRLKGDDHYADYVCSNPPYVGEKGHKDLFRYVTQSLPYWKQYYQGKMDYLYWFIILGLSKLKDGGRLSYITTSY